MRLFSCAALACCSQLWSATLPELAQQLPSLTEDGKNPEMWTLLLHGGGLYHDTIQHDATDGRRFENLFIDLVRRGGDFKVLQVGSPISGFNQRLLRSTDPSQLTTDGHNLSGHLELVVGREGATREMGHGDNGHSMMKRRVTPVLDWSIGGIERVHGLPEQFPL